MLDEMVIPVVKRLFERHFEMRLCDACHLELCLISLACLRQLSKTSESLFASTSEEDVFEFKIFIPLFGFNKNKEWLNLVGKIKRLFKDRQPLKRGFEKFSFDGLCRHSKHIQMNLESC